MKTAQKKTGTIAPAIQTWPFWANWCGLDPVGYWIFYDNKPTTTPEGRVPNGVNWGEPRECVCPVHGSWESLLFSRQDGPMTGKQK